MPSQENSRGSHRVLPDLIQAAGRNLANQNAITCWQTISPQVVNALAVRLLPNTKRRPATASDIDP